MKQLANFYRYKTALEYCCINGYSNDAYNDYIYKAISYHGSRFQKLYTLLDKKQLIGKSVGNLIVFDLMNLHTIRSAFKQIQKDQILAEFDNAYGFRPNDMMPEMPKSLVISFGKFKIQNITNNFVKFDSFGRSVLVQSIKKSDKVFSDLTKELNEINKSFSKNKSNNANTIDFTELRARLDKLNEENYNDK